MITIKGKKFAKNDKEAIDSLFTDKTIIGFYKRYKNKVNLYNLQNHLIGFITKEVIGCATILDNGKYWYTLGNIEGIGLIEYKEKNEIIKQIFDEAEKCKI